MYLRSELAIASILALCFSCGSKQNPGLYQNGKSFEITFEIQNPKEDTLRLFELDGPEQRQITYAIVEKKGNKGIGTISGLVPEEGVYFLGFGRQKGKLVVISNGSKFKITGDESFFQQSAKVTESKENEEFDVFYKQIGEYQQKIQQLQQELSKSKGNKAIENSLDSLFQIQTTLQQSKLSSPGVVGKIAKILYYPSYKTDSSHNKYADEMAYFKDQFMSGIDFKDTTMAYIPFYSEKLGYYIGTLTQLATEDEIKERLTAILKNFPKQSRMQKQTYVAIFQGVQRSSMDLLGYFGEMFLKDYPNDLNASKIKEIVSKIATVKIGAYAPDIVMKDPQGHEKKLSSLKGKVVLVDFWASWCGPCRKENPNVVRLYNQYKSKGFDIFSVSLDQPGAHDKWVEAIKKDGLIWENHVSDLAYWNSVATQLYMFSSIPYTVVLDKEGKIAYKNVRGPKLEEAIKELTSK